MRTSGPRVLGLLTFMCVAGCGPTTECTRTGAFDVRVGTPIPTPSAWLATLPSCGDQMDLPLGTVISFDTLGLDDDCLGTARVTAPTVSAISPADGFAPSIGYFGSPYTEGFVNGRLPSGCEGGWSIQVTQVDRSVRLARAFTPSVPGACPPIPVPMGPSRPLCIDFFDAALVE